MKINLTTVLDNANDRYAEKVLGKDLPYRAPEIRPKIQSRQVLSILEALVEEINKGEQNGEE